MLMLIYTNALSEVMVEVGTLVEKIMQAIFHCSPRVFVFMVRVKFVIDETCHHTRHVDIIRFKFKQLFNGKPVQLTRFYFRTANTQFNSAFLHEFIKTDPFIVYFVIGYLAHGLELCWTPKLVK